MSVRKILKVPAFFVQYFQDLVQFVSYNHYSPLVPRRVRLYYRIIISAHTIEKGLSLPAPKLLFGRVKIKELCGLMDAYEAAADPFPISMAVGALQEYVAFNRAHGCDDTFLTFLEEYCQQTLRRWCLQPAGGTKPIPISRQDLATHSDLHCQFLASRFSCRSYSDKRFDSALLGQIVKLAASAPSQCNRQSVRLHCFRSPQTISRLLELQGGSRGFSDNVPNLFVVTFELPGWGGPTQRNQGYVDGALFSMSLMYACHAMSVATCPLNLAISNETESKIRVAASIPSCQRLVMMVAAGYASENTLSSARSERIAVSSILSLHD